MCLEAENIKEAQTNRQKQAAASKNKLVAAAMELFNEKGYEQTTVQDICTRADLSVGVFYHYFPSKSDVLQTVRLRKNEELLDYISNHGHSRSIPRLFWNCSALLFNSKVQVHLNWCKIPLQQQCDEAFNWMMHFGFCASGLFGVPRWPEN